jgi:ubiquinone/menaquinone biosynthesis C-methylase UbiE
MSSSLQEKVKQLLTKPAIHRSWEATYRTIGIERLQEQLYDDIVRRIGQTSGSTALDIGCGPCFNSIRLARRGYRVTAADYSEAILPIAYDNVDRAQLSGVINPIVREDLLNLSFPDRQFDLVLAQGVLMHVPDLERAIAELTRVVKLGGFIVLEELNDGSPEARVMTALWRLFKKKKITITAKPAGHECSAAFEADTMFWRMTNHRWLVDQFAQHSCRLFHRDMGMCTEFWKYAPTEALKNVVHAWNRFCARRLNWPRLGYHNVYIFRKVEGA